MALIPGLPGWFLWPVPGRRVSAGRDLAARVLDSGCAENAALKVIDGF